MAARNAVVKNADMSEDMQQDAVDCASQALDKYNVEKVRAPHITQATTTVNFTCPFMLPGITYIVTSVF
jgi:hypothetical protein